MRIKITAACYHNGGAEGNRPGRDHRILPLQRQRRLFSRHSGGGIEYVMVGLRHPFKTALIYARGDGAGILRLRYSLSTPPLGSATATEKGGRPAADAVNVAAEIKYRAFTPL